MLIVDDALLLAVLAGVAQDDLPAAAERGEIYTTGSWYWRLGRALHDTTSMGALSRALEDLTADQQARVFQSVQHLPPEVGLLILRELVPVMAALDVGRRLNLLTAEALAAAVVLEATILVTTESSLLAKGSRRLGLEVRRISADST